MKLRSIWSFHFQTHFPPTDFPHFEATPYLSPVLIKTRNHVLAYDTGPTFGSRFDAGEQIVAPAARQMGARHIDHLIVSHGDNDHAGGVNGLKRALDIWHLSSSVPRLGRDCHAL
ncbi:MAG: hypothetical protein COB46_14385, partial [Rhodospirillaceae bacterium]